MKLTKWRSVWLALVMVQTAMKSCRGTLVLTSSADTRGSNPQQDLVADQLIGLGGGALNGNAVLAALEYGKGRHREVWVGWQEYRVAVEWTGRCKPLLVIESMPMYWKYRLECHFCWSFY